MIDNYVATPTYTPVPCRLAKYVKYRSEYYAVINRVLSLLKQRANSTPIEKIMAVFEVERLPRMTPVFGRKHKSKTRLLGYSCWLVCTTFC